MKRVLCIIFIMVFIFNSNVSLAMANDYEDGKNQGMLLGYREGLLLKNSQSLLLGKIKEWNNESIISQVNKEYVKGFIYGYEIGFMEGSSEYNLETNQTYDQGRYDGNYYAIRLAKINAENHYLLDIPMDTDADFSKKSQLRKDFNLRSFPKDYVDGFFIGFEQGLNKLSDAGYSFYYRKFYIEFNKAIIQLDMKLGELAGYRLGKEKAEDAVKIDIISNKTNDWTRHKVNDFQLINQYDLNLQSNNYIIQFINSFWNSFLETYMSNYNELYLKENIEKTHAEIIELSGKKNVGILGDVNFHIDIEGGTYYNPVALNINKTNIESINNKNDYIFASEAYEIISINENNFFDESKNIILKIRCYGAESNYGIYKYENQRWIPLVSKKNGDFLETSIKSGDIHNKKVTYAIVVSNHNPKIHDIRGHWAKSEIEFFIRSNIVTSHSQYEFKPNKEISKEEALKIFFKYKGWDIVLPDFYYGNKSLTYGELENVMKELFNKIDFAWDTYAKKLIYEKNIRSSSVYSMNNNISRAEFVFMLYNLNDW